MSLDIDIVNHLLNLHTNGNKMINEIEQIVQEDIQATDLRLSSAYHLGKVKSNICSIMHTEDDSNLYFTESQQQNRLFARVNPKDLPANQQTLYYSNSLNQNVFMPEGIELKQDLDKQPMILMPYCSHSVHLACANEFSDQIYTFSCPDCE